jgi:hypothetical protein
MRLLVVCVSAAAAWAMFAAEWRPPAQLRFVDRR